MRRRYVTAFLEATLRDRSGRFVVVRDGGHMHKGDPIRRLEAHFAGRLSLVQWPPFAPMLSPTEPPWSLLEDPRPNDFAPETRPNSMGA